MKPTKLIYLLLCLITVVCYFPTFLNDFQYAWDDQWQVLEYEFVLNHSFSDLVYHFTHFHLGQYMPVNTLLYIIIYKIWGFNALAFHTASLFFHLLNVCLVFVIIKTILERVKNKWEDSRIYIFSFIVALVFAIHPLQVESVAWISASKIILYTFFCLLGIKIYLNYLKTNRIGEIIAVLVCYLLAYGSKEQALIFPLNLIIIDYILKRFNNLPQFVKRLKSRVVIEKIPFIVCAILLYLFSVQNNLGTFEINTYPLNQRLLFGMSSFMDYVFRFLAPVKLYYFYFFPIEIGESLPNYFWSYPILMLILVGFIWYNYKKKNQLVVFGFLLFIINILLVLHIVPMPRKMITADRYMYFSIIGLGITLAWFTVYLFSRFRKWRTTFVSIISVWFIFLALHTYSRTGEWKNSDSVKQNVTELIEKRKANKQAIVNNPLNEVQDETN